MTSPPLLESEHFLLRPHTLDDFADSAALWADPMVTRFIRETPFTKEESWNRLLRYIGHWSALDYGYWVAIEKSSNQFAGEMGFADYKRAVEPSIEGMPEAGWALAARFHGKGVAT